MKPFKTAKAHRGLAGLLAGLASLAITTVAPARQVSIHDPVMAKEGNTFFLYSTGPGVTFYSSTDMLHWRLRGRVFPGEPAWAREVAPRFNGHLWAPDISHYNGRYYLYYSVSAFGRNTSAIGVTVNKTLDPSSPDYHWEDHGIVVRSVPYRDLWNAIDPNLVVDDDGTPWLAFGSFWSGIKLVKLTPDRLSIAEPEVWHSLAKRERSVLLDDALAGPAQIEAPFIFKKNGYYYLFVSWDKCCRGKDSTYKMVVGRATKLTGPYLDHSGEDMTKGGGMLFLAGNKDFAGVGHCGVYTFGGKDYVVFHAYENADNGLQKLKIAQIRWDADLWPHIDESVLHDYVSVLEP